MTLPNTAMSQDRVNPRVEEKGHFVVKEKIEYNFIPSLENSKKICLSI